MTASLSPYWRMLLFLLCLTAAPGLARAAKPPLLRYRADAPTNAYSVTIEFRGESGKETLSGNIITFTRPAGSNVISFSFRGNLLPRRDSMGMSYNGRPPRWMQPINLSDGGEILMDPQGHVFRTSGDFPLPLPLGSVAQLFVPAVPDKAVSKWEFVDELPALDEPLGLGPMRGFGLLPSGYSMYSMYGPGSTRNLSAVIMLTQQTKAEIKSNTLTTAIIKRRLTWDSPLLAGAEPRISASEEGTQTFDNTQGFLRSAEAEFQALLNSDTSTRRTTAKLKIQLLEGKEREAALTPLLNRPTIDPASGQMISRKLTGEELQKIFAELQSDDDAKRRTAASRLQSAELVNPPRALLDYLTNHLFNAESPLRLAAVRIIADFGSTENVPDLIRLLKNGESSYSYSAARGLGRLKDPRAIEPLVECIAAGGSEAYQASSALDNFDAGAEDAVLGLLKEKNTGTKRTACNILRKLGTTKSIELLKDLVTHQDSMLSSAAGEAIRAIQSRN